MTATVGTTPNRQLALGPHDLAQRVPCTICHAVTGAPCTEPDGLERVNPHNSRWIRYQHLMRQRPFTARVVQPVDERVEVGDLLLVVATPEGNVLRVLPDGMGSRDLPEYIDAGAVDFQAFVEDARHGVRGQRGAARRPARRPQFGGAA